MSLPAGKSLVLNKPGYLFLHGSTEKSAQCGGHLEIGDFHIIEVIASGKTFLSFFGGLITMVGGFNPCLKILANGKDYPIYYGKIKNRPNHQPGNVD